MDNMSKYCITILLLFSPALCLAIGSTVTITTDSQFSAGTLDKVMITGTGSSARVELLDTWYYHSVFSGPQARYNTAIAYDKQNKVIVLFGGMSQSTVLSDTWIYNPSTNRWTQKYNPNSPSAREGHSMVYLGNGKTAVFGGRDSNGYLLNDVWIYDVTYDSWQQQNITNQGPAARTNSALVSYHENFMIIFGGLSGTDFLNDTWQYNVAGSSWTQINSGTGSVPAKRALPAVCYDKDNNKIILFGGYSNITYYQDTWTYNPSSLQWTLLNPSSSFPAARITAMAYDETNHCAVIFGGEDSNTKYDDTWWYNINNNKWVWGAPRDVPDVRGAHAMAYVTDTERSYIFGGRGLTGYFNDVWSFVYSIQGTFISSAIDVPFDTELTWDKVSILPQAQPSNTLIQLQIATSTDTYTWTEFKGYDGTNNTGYAYAGVPVNIWEGHKNQRYLKFKTILNSSVMPASPIMEEVILYFNRYPYAPALNTPYNGTRNGSLTPVFSWYNASDEDNDNLLYRLQISSSSTFTNSYIDVSSITVTQHTILTGLYEGQWFWRVSSNDSKGESTWSKYYTVFIDTTPPSAVTDLQASIGLVNGSISLTWTAPGENGTIGNIISGYYWLKYSTSGPILTEFDWTSTTGEKKYIMSTVPGQRETKTIENLSNAATYFFTIKVMDNPGNLSYLSLNSPSEYTNAPPEIILISPNGNEIWQLNQNIVWTTSDPNSNDTQTFMMYLSTNEGISYDVVLSSGLSDGTTTLLWNTLLVPNGTKNRIKVVDTDKRGLQGIAVSSTNFTINNTNYAPELTIAGLQNNEVLFSTATISWLCIDKNLTDTHQYTIKISSDAGNSWNTVIEGLSEGTTFYKINTTIYPNGTRYRILISVEDNGTPIMNDEKVSNDFIISNNNFPPNSFSLLTPGKGEEMGLEITFTWETAADPNLDDSVTYILWYSIYPDFSEKTEIKELQSNRYSAAGGLSAETTYWWIVKAVDSLNAETLPLGGTSYFVINHSRADSDDGKLQIKVTRGMPANAHLRIRKLNVNSDPEISGVQEKNSANTLLYSISDYAYKIELYDLQNQLVQPGNDFEMVITVKYTDTDNDGYSDEKSLPAKNLRVCQAENNGWQRVPNNQNINSSKKTITARAQSTGMFSLFGYVPATNIISEIHCYPNPFYPYKETAMIKYVLTADCKIQLRIYNLFGDLVWSQDKNPGEDGSKGVEDGYTNQTEWNGRNGQNMIVGNGSYLCVVSAQPKDSSQISQLKYLIGVMK